MAADRDCWTPSRSDIVIFRIMYALFFVVLFGAVIARKPADRHASSIVIEPRLVSAPAVQPAWGSLPVRKRP